MDLYSLINCTILTVDSNDTIFADGVIVIDGTIIKEIGTKDQIVPKGKIIDMQNKIIMPGLINTHTHSHSSLFKNIADDLKLMDWLKKAMWPMEKHLNSECAKAATALSCLEYIKSGITCYADQFYFANDIVHPAMQSGLRVFLAATVFANPCAETDNTFKAAKKFVENYINKQNETLIYPCIGPHAPYSVTEELWKDCIMLAKKYNLIIHTHISETIEENNEIFEKTKLSPTKWLDSIGVFEQRVLAAHSIHLDDEDLEIYKNKNVKVSFNPVSNLKLTSGIMPMKKMMQKGINISLGTDGAQSNNSMDLIRDVREGALVQKQINNNPTFFSAKESVKMITINGAKALEIDNIVGSLEVGKKADIISLDLTSPRLCPFHKNSVKNIYSTIAYSAIGADVCDSIVNGKFIMKDKNVLTFDEKEVINNAQKASEYLIKKSSVL